MSDLLALFAKDPLKYTKEDVRAIVDAYREKRKQFNSGAIMAGKVKAPPAKAKALSAAINGDDLDI